MSEQDGRAKREWIEDTLDTIGAVLAGSLQAIHTREGRMRGGIAFASRLPKPVSTPYGTFVEQYDYEDGCTPAREFSHGIGAIETRARTVDSHDVIYLIGKKHPDDQDYHMGVYKVDAGTEATRIGGCVINEEDLPPQIAIGATTDEFGGWLASSIQSHISQIQGIETAGAIITGVRGLTNGSRS